MWREVAVADHLFMYVCAVPPSKAATGECAHVTEIKSGRLIRSLRKYIYLVLKSFQ